jgi:hypothetical protein
MTDRSARYDGQYDGRYDAQYDGRTFAPAGGGPARGRYRQVDDLVWAAFSGGTIRAGHLVGRADPDGVIHAAYCQLMASGETVAGHCTSSPSILADGRLRLTERWQRLDGTTGTSVIEEVA